MIQEEDILAIILDEQYHHFPGTTVTVCCLRLQNGFAVIGYSACLDDREFDSVTGEIEAKKDAIDKIYQLEGYLEKEAAFQEAKEAGFEPVAQVRSEKKGEGGIIDV